MFYFGLDLGQVSDYTAGIILQASGEGDTRTYDVRHIEQYPLGTSYPQIVKAVEALLARAPLAGDCTLAIDHTSVGRPVYDMFVAEGRRPLGITITGGTSWHVDPEHPSQWHVSKIMLVGTVQRLLQSGRLRIGANLPHATTLHKELRDFRVKISKSANETYDAREGSHDDLVLSLAVAAFAGERWTPAISISPHDMAAIWRAQGYEIPQQRTIAPRWRWRDTIARQGWRKVDLE